MAAVIAISMIQLLIPLFVLLTTEEPPGRFGWQMFAASKPPPTVTVVYDDGERSTLSASQWIGRYRPEVSYERYLPGYVCAHEPDVSLVIVRGSEHEC